MNHSDIKPCPFCGKEIDINDPDTLYPSGVSWVSIEEESGIEGLIAYVSSKEYPEANRCYQLICQVHQGGCGAEMHGDSVEEVLTKWNKRSSM